MLNKEKTIIQKYFHANWDHKSIGKDRQEGHLENIFQNGTL